MNNKGFTMIELLAIITILSLILLISFPTLINITRSDKEKEYSDLVNTLCKAGETYIYNNRDAYSELNNTGSVFHIRILDLINDDLVNKSQKNPKTGKLINYDVLKFKVNSDKSLNCSYVESEIESEIASEYIDYRGYYADVDGDGTPDGVIYADLSVPGKDPITGEWGPGYDGQHASDGEYSYGKEKNLKRYTISKNKYNGNFGEKEIITLIPGTTGKSRFYIIALEDFVTTDYTVFVWYESAYNKMSTYATDTSLNFGKGYANTGKIIDIWNKNGIGEGSYSEAIQNNQDIWKYIQTKYQEGWYIPSRGEWGAFADYFEIISDCDTGYCVENSGNYNSTYGLSSYYWSSSQNDTGNVWIVDFYFGYLDRYTVDVGGYVRLGTTF